MCTRVLAGEHAPVAELATYSSILLSVAELVGADRWSRRVAWSGASRTRTGDLLRATQALSRLSYSPKLVIGRPV